MVYTQKFNRDTLVDNAYDLLEREGVEALSMRRLAQLVDVRASSLYHHFPEKSSLLAAVAEKGLFHLAQQLERARTIAGSDPSRQLQALGITYREWAMQHPQVYRLLFTGAPPINNASSDSPTAAFKPVLTTISQLVTAPEVTSATQAFWAFLHGYIMLELTGHMQECIPVEGFLLGLSCFTQGLNR